MNIAHNSMVIHSCAKYSMTMSKLWPEHEAIYIYVCQKRYIWPWGQQSKWHQDHKCTGHIIWWWKTHMPNMICQNKQKLQFINEAMLKKPINLTLRSKIKVILESWMYTKHRFMVIHPCAKHRMPKSKQKEVNGRTGIYRDRRIDRFLYIPPMNLIHGA